MKNSKNGLNKRKVVAYCRVSTLEQKKKGRGIDIQIRDVTLFAERRGVLVERFYRDEGESGIKENRRALTRLLRHCKAGYIGVIILPSLDRLSREVRIAENLFYEFKRLGVKVIIADMPQYNGESKDILVRQIFEAIAEDNRREIIERLWKGRQERVTNGLFPGGNLPYGYVRHQKQVTIHPKESIIVKVIFKGTQEYRTGQAIANELNRRGFKMRNGKLWTQRQVCRIIQREALYREGALHYGNAIAKNNAYSILGTIYDV